MRAKGSYDKPYGDSEAVIPTTIGTDFFNNGAFAAATTTTTTNTADTADTAVVPAAVGNTGAAVSMVDHGNQSYAFGNDTMPVNADAGAINARGVAQSEYDFIKNRYSCTTFDSHDRVDQRERINDLRNSDYYGARYVKDDARRLWYGSKGDNVMQDWYPETRETGDSTHNHKSERENSTHFSRSTSKSRRNRRRQNHRAHHHRYGNDDNSNEHRKNSLDVRQRDATTNPRENERRDEDGYFGALSQRIESELPSKRNKLHHKKRASGHPDQTELKQQRSSDYHRSYNQYQYQQQQQQQRQSERQRHPQQHQHRNQNQNQYRNNNDRYADTNDHHRNSVRTNEREHHHGYSDHHHLDRSDDYHRNAHPREHDVGNFHHEHHDKNKGNERDSKRERADESYRARGHTHYHIGSLHASILPEKSEFMIRERGDSDRKRERNQDYEALVSSPQTNEAEIKTISVLPSFTEHPQTPTGPTTTTTIKVQTPLLFASPQSNVATTLKKRDNLASDEAEKHHQHKRARTQCVCDAQEQLDQKTHFDNKGQEHVAIVTFEIVMEAMRASLMASQMNDRRYLPLRLCDRRIGVALKMTRHAASAALKRGISVGSIASCWAGSSSQVRFLQCVPSPQPSLSLPSRSSNRSRGHKQVANRSRNDKQLEVWKILGSGVALIGGFFDDTDLPEHYNDYPIYESTAREGKSGARAFDVSDIERNYDDDDHDRVNDNRASGYSKSTGPTSRDATGNNNSNNDNESRSTNNHAHAGDRWGGGSRGAQDFAHEYGYAYDYDYCVTNDDDDDDYISSHGDTLDLNAPATFDIAEYRVVNHHSTGGSDNNTDRCYNVSTDSTNNNNNNSCDGNHNGNHGVAVAVAVDSNKSIDTTKSTTNSGTISSNDRNHNDDRDVMHARSANTKVFLVYTVYPSKRNTGFRRFRAR